MNGSHSFPPLHVLAVFSIETLLRQQLPLPQPLRARLAVPTTQLRDALRELSQEMRVALFECIQAHAAAEGLAGPLTLPELRSFLLGESPAESSPSDADPVK